MELLPTHVFRGVIHPVRTNPGSGDGVKKHKQSSLVWLTPGLVSDFCRCKSELSFLKALFFFLNVH